jgi:putative transcriptional regulator
MSIETSDKTPDMPVYFGGPVEHGRGFVLHSRDYISDISTLEVSSAFAMTATQDILEDIAVGNGPASAMMVLGYAGWGPGQLEQEISQNGWLTGEASHALIFENPADEIWPDSLRRMGVDALALSATAGRA